jgi:hypothetical protein
VHLRLLLVPLALGRRIDEVHAGGRDHLKTFMFLCAWTCVRVYFGGNK